jgi:glycerophosphoryl diester phosphodiesterase
MMSLMMHFKPMNMKNIVLILIMLMTAKMADAQEFIAHRGASYLAPENTIASVKLGFELGAEAVEIDVHLSKDNRIMVIHDKGTKRVAGGIDLVVSETHSKELRKLDVGIWKDEKFKGEKIPFLEEILPLIPGNQKLFVEFKTGPEILPHFNKVLKKHGDLSKLVIISFNKEAIIGSKKMFPEIPAYWLLGNFNQYSLEEAIQIALDHHLNGLNVHYNLVNEEFMEKMNSAGLEVYTYTVNYPEIAEQLRALNANGITTDRPRWLREQMAAK